MEGNFRAADVDPNLYGGSHMNASSNTDQVLTSVTCKSSHIMDLLMGHFRGAVFHQGRVPENNMGRFPSSMGRFLTLRGRFPRGQFPKCLSGLFYPLKIRWKTAHEEIY